MSGVVDIYGTTPRLGRRSMALADIDPKYVSQSGIWEASEVETSRGSIRIQHLTAVSAGPRPLSCSVTSGSVGPLSHGANSRFPKLEECAHFHYDVLELPPLKLSLRSEEPYKSGSSGNSCGSGDEIGEKYTFSIEVVSGGQCWAIRRTHANLCKLDEQLHRCVWDRSFSQLAKVNDSDNEDESEEEHDECRALIERYLNRLSELPTNQITCGSVLSFFEIDNRGRHIVSTDDSAINTPAVAAACAVRKYVAQAADELSFEVGDMISVIDMPPPEESIWWRGKRKFHVGFFPRECVQVIGEKVPMGLPIVPSTRKLQRLSVSSNASSADSSAPEKPVLRKHGKLIAFFRSFILSRPSRRTLKQSGILRERVFGCDLAEHLLNSETDIPVVLKCCSEFIESHGIVDGIYRLSGITSNIQKLRITFDEGRIPNLEEDNAIKQDIHAVSSLLKMYFRDLPNPLCTYQLYEKFVAAAQASDAERLFRMREVAQQLPPPHFRTLEYLLKHLARVADNSNQTGMTPKNMAIVWAPNLIRCKELEAGGVAALKGIGVQAVVTEYLVRHADLIFSDKLTVDFPETTSVISNNSPSGRPKSLAISSPMRLMSLEEAQDKAKDDRKYIDVGGGPANLPPKYHTVIDIPGRRSSMKSKRTPTGWKHFFSRNRSFSKPPRKDITVVTKSTPPVVQQGLQANWGNRLRPVKSVESLVSSPLYQSSTSAPPSGLSNTLEVDESVEEVEIHNHNIQESQSSPVSPVTGIVEVQIEPEIGMRQESYSNDDSRPLQNSKTHNRSISHDSYFEFGEFLKKNGVYIDETLEEENSQTESRDSLEDSSEIESPRKERSSGAFGDCESMASPRNTHGSNRVSFGSPMTPPASIPSLRLGLPKQSTGCGMQSSSSEEFNTNSTPQQETDENETVLSKSPLLKPKPRYSLLRHMECQTSMTKLTDIGVSTMEDGDFNHSVSVVTKDSIGINTDEVFPTSATTFKEIGDKFELDRNSSVDDSSTDTTPGGDAYALTNIIYSPLINDMSSCSANSPASSVEKLYGNAENAKISGLFICPLYEAGVETGDSGSSAAAAPHKSYRTRIHQYENLGTIMDSFSEDESEPVTVQAVTNTTAPAEIQPSKSESANTYENERLYQNDEFQQSQISIVKLEGPMSTSPDNDEDEEEGKNFYENWNGQGQDGEEEEENNYETVIYEDVGNEKDEHGEDDEEQHCYETIEVATAAAKQLGEALSSTAKANEPKPDPPEEEESAYEDVRFVYLSKMEAGIVDKAQPVPEQVPVAPLDLPQNAEMSKQATVAVSPNQESSASPSYTDDMVTYLEIGSTNDNDNIKLKLRNNSIEEESLRIPVQSSFSSDGSPSSEENPEIRHIDSPLVVDNPLYGLQLEEQMQNGNGNYESNRKPLEKLIVRCNSAPAAEETAAGRDFALELAIRTLNAVKNVNQNERSEENNRLAAGDPAKLLPLFKRMSEPSLLSNDKSSTAAAATAWKASDAKRLTHRKSSVKELLSKFEPREGLSPSPSPTHSVGSGGPGLPRPDSRSTTLRHKNSNNNGQRFQHHRFSMGDILMTQSMSSADDGNDNHCGGTATMIRSDTFPELRTDSSKENGICGGGGNSLESGSCSDRDNYGDCESSSVAEKVHHALRVAMSSVDMNDPSRRERIEKYKEERRIFLRQKISSEITEPPPTPKPSLSSTSDSAKCSILSLKSPDRTSFSSVENDSVFPPPDDQQQSGKKFNSTSSSTIESPRKRAFSEDVSPGSGSPNQSVTKSIKTEQTIEEINVREKVAAWTTSDRRIYSHSASTSFMELGSPKSGAKAGLKETMSLPIEGFESSANNTPKHQLLFRRDYSPTASLEITKTKMISSSRTSGGGGGVGDSGNANGNNGKKIKDIAAFFERKGF